MKNMITRKAISLMLMLLMLVSSFVPYTAAFADGTFGFEDFPTGWSREAVTAAVNNGLLNGKSETTLDPEGNLTRAEMATVINRAFGAEIEADISNYIDVSPDAWYYHEIAKAVNMQTFQGDGNGTMRPDDSITREEIFAVLARAFVLETNDYSSLNRFNDADMLSDWAKPYAAVLSANKYVNGDDLSNLNPQANITREEFAQIMHNMVKRYITKDGEYKTIAEKGNVVIRVPGVTLKGVTINGDLVLGDGVGKGDITLENVTIKGRLLTRGGEGKVSLKKTTVDGGVVVKDVNGTVNFNNYRTEKPFKDIIEITPATFLKPTGGGGGSYTPPTPPPADNEPKFYIKHYKENEGGGWTLHLNQPMNVPAGNVGTIAAISIDGYNFNSTLGDGIKVGNTLSINNDDVFELYYTLPTHKNITLYANGGSFVPGTSTTITAPIGQNIGTLPEPTLADYTFGGWYKENTYENKVEDSTLVTRDFPESLHAKWRVKVSFFDDNGVSELPGIDDKTIDIGDVIDISALIPTKGSEVFNGWYTEISGGVEFTSYTPVTKNINVYAKWSAAPVTKHNVIFDAAPGIFKLTPEVSELIVPVEDGKPASKPVEPVRDGWIFDGWYKDGTEFDFSTVITAPITLSAKWSIKPITLYKVSFNTMGGTPEVGDITGIQYGETITAPKTNPTKTAMVFDGWYKDIGCTDKFIFETDKITNNITLYAKWKDAYYTVSFDLNGGTGTVPPSADYKHGTKITNKPSANPTRVSYIFDGWYVSLGGSYVKFNLDSDVVTEGMTLRAEWILNEHTISVETYGANETVSDSIVVSDGSPLSLPTTLTKSNAVFDGWYTDSAFANQYNNEPISADGEIFAKWLYTVSFDLNGGTSGAIAPISNVVHGTSVADSQKPADPSKTDKNFAGWYTDAACTKVFTFGLTVVTESITLYAKWTDVPVEYVNVRFHYNGDDLNKGTQSGEIVKGTNAAEPTPAPTKAGHTFMGWYTDNNSWQNKFNFTEKVNDDLDLYAYWKINTYDVYFNVGTGATVNPMLLEDVKYGEVNIPRPTTYKEGHKEDSWYTDAAYTKEFTFGSDAISGETNLYLKWKKHEYTVSLVTGNDTNEIIYAYNVPYGPYTPQDISTTKTGYKFTGWKLGENDFNAGDIIKSTNDGDTITLTATWEAIYYNVAYDGNNATGGMAMMPDSVKYGDDYVVRNSSYTKTGYSFDGWSDKINPTKVVYSSGEVVKNLLASESTITLYAVWNENSYTVVYNGNGATSGNMPNSLSHKYTELWKLDNNQYSKTGHSFKGWSLTKDGAKVYDNMAEVSMMKETAGEITLYAVWETNSYETSFVLSDGEEFKTVPSNYTQPDSKTAQITIKYGEKYQALPELKDRVGWRFVGWFDGDGNQITANTTVGAANITVSAKWTQKDVYKVKYHNYNADGTYIELDVIEDEKLATAKPPVPTKIGYTFEGWYEDDDHTIAFNFENIASGHEDVYVNWTANKYTVEYYNETGSSKVMTDSTYEYNKVDTLKLKEASVTKKGYTFTGWATEPNGMAIHSDGAAVDNWSDSDGEVIRLYASWKPNTYKIIYDKGAADAQGTMLPDTLTYDVPYVIKDSVYLREGYSFINWSYNGSTYTAGQSVENLAESGEVTLTANWKANKYWIQYNPNGGSGTIEKTEFEYGSNNNRLTSDVFVREGYTFLGWAKTPGATSADYASGAVVTENLSSIAGAVVDLHAVWSENKYTVKYHGNGDDGTMSMADSEFKYTDYKTLSANQFKKKGYTFAGWALSSTGTKVYDDKAYVEKLSSSDGDVIDLYATWNKISYTVAYNGNGHTSGIMGTTTHKYDEPQNLPALKYQKTGYTFVEWEAPDGSAYSDGASVVNLADSDGVVVTLTAKWSANTYTVKYNRGSEYAEGTTPNSTHTYDMEKALNANEFTRKGYTFDGWALEAGSDAAYADKAPVKNLIDKGEITLYATWKANSYTVIYDKNNAQATGTMTASDFTYDKEESLSPLAYQLKGHSFKGWTVASDGSGTVYTDKAKVKNLAESGSVTLYAKWEANSYKLTFTLQQGESFANPGVDPDNDGTVEIDVTYGETYPELPKLNNKADKYFAGWEVDGSPIKEGAYVNITDDAQPVSSWSTRVPHNVVFKNYYGLGSGKDEPDTVIDGNSVKRPENDPIVTGYTFGGWYKDKNFSDEYTFTDIIANLAGDTTTVQTIEIYAKWTANSFKVFYDKNASNAEGQMTESTFTYDMEAKLKKSSYSLKGHTQTGWTENANGSGRQFELEADVRNLLDRGSITLYAKWEANSYKLTFTLQPGESFADPTIDPDNDGTVELDVTYGETYPELPKLNNKADKYFAGWKIGNTPINKGDNIAITNNESPEAIWSTRVTHNVIFVNHNGPGSGKDKNGTVVDGNTVTRPVPDPTTDGYTFDNWYTDDSYKDVYTFTKEIKNPVGDTTSIKTEKVYAKWTANNYTVIYDKNDSNADGSMENSEFTYDSAANLRENIFKLDGHEFLYWATNADGSGEIYDDKEKVKNLASKGEVKLYAIWKAKTYTVTLKLLPGDNFVDPSVDPDGDRKVEIKVTFGEAFPELPKVKDKGTLKFKAWKDSIGNEYKKGTEVIITDDIELTPGWTDKDEYTVSYHDVIDGSVTSDALFEGDIIKQPTEAPKRTGYSFDGYYTDSSCTTTYEFGDPISANVDVWLKFTPNTYSIRYNPGYVENGVEAVDDTRKFTYDVDDDTITLWSVSSMYNRDGYTFDGWAKSDGTAAVLSDGAKVYNLTDKPNDIVNLWAVWTKQDTEELYTVSFYDGAVKKEDCLVDSAAVSDGSMVEESFIEYVVSASEMEALTRETTGYEHIINPEFWYINSAGEWEIFDKNVVVDRDIDVFYTYKYVDLAFSSVKLPGINVNQSVVAIAPYDSDSRIIKTGIDLALNARGDIVTALSVYPDLYQKLISEAAAKSKGIIDSDGSINHVMVDIGINEIIKPEEIGGEIREYIEHVLTKAGDNTKLESALLMVYGSGKFAELMKDKEIVSDGFTWDVVSSEAYLNKVKTYINGLTDSGKLSFAGELYDALTHESYYDDFIKAFENNDESFVVNEKDINFIMAVAHAVGEYTYDSLKSKIYASFGSVIDLIGDSAAESFMMDAQRRYVAGADKLWDEVKDMDSFTKDYPTYLTFRVNPIEHIIRPLYDKYYDKAVERFKTNAADYDYDNNTNLKALVEKTKLDILLDELLNYTAPAGADSLSTGYSIKGDILYYYDYALDKLIKLENALCYYRTLYPDDADYNDFINTIVYRDMADALDRMNSVFGKEGEITAKLEKIKENEKLAGIYNTLKPIADKVVARYKDTVFYNDNDWTTEEMKEQKEAKLIVNILFSNEDKEFTADDVFALGYFTKAMSKLGFADYDLAIPESVKLNAYKGDFAKKSIELNGIRISNYFYGY